MLNVFFTVDVEIWCDGWSDIDAKFPAAFRKYVYGPTAKGEFGLPYQLRVLDDYGLPAAFFVEPLFSTRFGAAPLAELVGLLREARQEIQLHLHTEWVDESRQPILALTGRKRQHLREFSAAEQEVLIAAGRSLLLEAGCERIEAFRAGSFGFNHDTLLALGNLEIPMDSSYNATAFGLDSGLMPGTAVVDVVRCDRVTEYPMTVYSDGTRSLRHVQLTACSQLEMEGLLWQAAEAGRAGFVILSHNFELLNLAMNRADDVVVSRFRKLCAFLDRNRDVFRVRGFAGLSPSASTESPAPLASPLWKTGARMAEQLYRRRYG